MNPFNDWEKQILTLPTNKVFSFIQEMLEKQGYIVCGYSPDHYLVMEPFRTMDTNTKVLVAHVDTVCSTQQPKLYQDLVCGDRFCTGGYEGFDDRLGVILIMRLIIDYGIKCPVIFLDQEEAGCVGALQLTKDFPKLTDLFSLGDMIQCFIEVDRHGEDEVVFYELNSPQFEKQFLEFYNKNISHAWTDISVIGPHYELAAANVSAGYYEEHTKDEHMYYSHFQEVEKRLRRTIAAMPDDTIWSYEGSCNTYTVLSLGGQRAISPYYSYNVDMDNLYFDYCDSLWDGDLLQRTVNS